MKSSAIWIFLFSLLSNCQLLGWAEDAKCVRDGTTEQMLYCSAQDTQKFDQQRIRLVLEISRLLTLPEAKKLLSDSEAGWVRYRDAQCSLKSYTREGLSMPRFMEAGCRRYLSEQRVKELQTVKRDLLD